MMEAYIAVAKQYLTEAVSLGFGFGSLLSVISILTGYAISKGQSLVNDK